MYATLLLAVASGVGTALVWRTQQPQQASLPASAIDARSSTAGVSGNVLRTANREMGDADGRKTTIYDDASGRQTWLTGRRRHGDAAASKRHRRLLDVGVGAAVWGTSPCKTCSLWALGCLVAIA